MSTDLQEVQGTRNLSPLFMGWGDAIPRHQGTRLQPEAIVMGSMTNMPAYGARPISSGQLEYARPDIHGIIDLQRGQLVVAPHIRTSLEIEAQIAEALADLKALRTEEQESEHPITPFAYSVAAGILRVAYRESACLIPPPAIAPDEEGGIRIEWVRPNRNVRAVIPRAGTLRSYIYHRIGAESGIDKLSGVKLAERLKEIIL